jgi:hypothetical protein
MNIVQAIALLEARIGPREVTNIESEEVEAWLNTALQRLSREKYEQGSKDYQLDETLTLGGDGSVALPDDAYADPADEEKRIRPVTRVTHASDSLPFVWMDSREDMDYDACGEYSLFTIENRTIYTKPKRGSETTVLSGDITATIIIIPALGSVLAKDEGRFIDIVTEIGHERLKLNPIGRDSRKRVSNES